jgi:iron complex transport system substrate-binding protein
MRRFYAFYYLIFIAAFVSCKQENPNVVPDAETNTAVPAETIAVKYATGFSIEQSGDDYRVTINNPWPDATTSYEYLFTAATSTAASNENYQVIQVPANRIVATSTTHIPPIVLLKDQEKIVGFPSTDYISDKKVRQLIDAGKIVDLGVDQNMDLEATIYTKPDVVIGYGVTDENPLYGKLQRAGIPVLYNGDWTEEHPLGKAEWIKLYGILLGKSQEAVAIFNQIEKDYLETLTLVENTSKPKVIAGATWKDVWYLPYGNSWQGKILNDAAANYVYADTEGKGSLSYNIERVLTDARDAEYWIAPAQYTSYSKMQNDQKAYTLFDSFKNKKVYTFALNKGEKGGVTYYEEASMRPDLVLKDLVKILHPELELDHELYFFAPLED